MATPETEVNVGAGLRAGSVEEELPAYDQAAIGKVVSRVEIENVDLVRSFFRRRDEEGFADPPTDAAPEFGIDPRWTLSEDEALLSCLIAFTAFFDDESEAPYELGARFRITYRLDSGESLTDQDLMVFTTWNAVFNTWSYWREFVGSTLGRAQLPQVMVPVIRVPGWAKDVQTDE